MIKCIAPGCTIPAAEDSALCPDHRKDLQKIEDDILKNATRKVRQEMRQFERLLYIEPPLHSAEISFRMAQPVRWVKRMLKRFKDDRV